MTTLRALRSAYAQAGAVNALLAPCAFLGDVLLTKAGDVGLCYRLGGIDYEGLDDRAREQHTHRLEAALRGLDESCRVSQYLLKRRAPAVHGRPVYALDRYLVLMLEGQARPVLTWRDRISPSRTVRLSSAALDRALALLEQQARGLESHLADAQPVRLSTHEAFRFLRRLVNAHDPGVRLQGDTHVDYQLAGESVELQRDGLIVGSTRVKILTMKEAPSATHPVLLDGLYALPGEFTACFEWQRMPVEQARAMVHTRRRHFQNKRTSLLSHANDTAPEHMLVDQSAGATIAQLGDALIAMDAGHAFGTCSLTFAAYGDEADRVAGDAAALLAAHDGALLTETYGALAAWCAMVPGNHALNYRRVALLETHAADLSFLFAVASGAERDLAGRPSLMPLVTRQATAYRFGLHVQDVGHTLVLGATGSGKTTVLHTIAEQAQPYRPRTVIFDLGHGYRDLTARMGGSYLTFGMTGGPRINPFALEPTREHLDFLHAFVRVLLEGRGAAPLTDVQDADLREQVRSLYVLKPEDRRLGNLSLRPELKPRLAKWVEGGWYGHLFDHADDELSLAEFQAFEFSRMDDGPDVREALLFYVLHRVNMHVESSRLTLCLMDEAWRFLAHPVLRSYVQTALKTWRKRNGAMVLATQSVTDLDASAMRDVVVSACPTHILLADYAADREAYARIFSLNARQQAMHAALRPRGELLLKRGDEAKVLALVLPEAEKEMAYAG